MPTSRTHRLERRAPEHIASCPRRLVIKQQGSEPPKGGEGSYSAPPPMFI